MNKYYDGSKLLTLKDLNGETPEIYICTSNRTAGKTTYFNRYAMNRWLKRGEKFALLYRFNYELDDVSDKFFKDIGKLFFPGYSMTSQRSANGIYHELYLEYPDSTPDNVHKECCGYAITLNSADQLKKYSHLFSDVSLIIFDEFQSETNHYCANEIRKFQSIHTSIARGNGAMTRYVPCVLISNPVSIINPYYVALGISNRLLKNTHFLRGDGWVLEQSYNENAANALKQSAFMRAFKDTLYTEYASSGKYLNDTDSFIQKMPENGRYLLTLRYLGKDYSVKEYMTEGILYVSDSVDPSFPSRLAIDLEDHQLNYVMLEAHSNTINQYKRLFELGLVRFKNQLCKNAFLAFAGYNTLK